MKIVFLDEYSLGEASLEAIRSLGEYTGYEITRSADEVVERAIDAEIVICNKVILSRETLSRLPKLELVCIAATGMNNIDLDAAKEFGIEVRNAVGYSTHSVAEATLGAVLSLLREISYYDRYIKSGEYAKSDRLFCLDRPIGQLAGSNWGVIGLGAIGREVARLATAFGCCVKFFSTSGAIREEDYDRAESLEELLSWSDIVSIHAPLNAATKDLIGEREFEMMRKSAILINVARGGIVDERALVEALNQRRIAAAALDVFSCEPIEPSSPLLTINNPDNIRLSPHNAWQSTKSIEKLVAAIAKNIENHKTKLIQPL
ncbi:MAG: NAD(P)-dependent oxidoreductase [Rikenellaceae bacterium]